MFHITSRVNWRRWLLADESARRAIADVINEAAELFLIRIYAWVIMANHLHLVAQSPSEPAFRRLTGRRTKCRHFRPYPLRHQKASVLAQFMRRVRHRTSIRRHRELELSGRFWENHYDARLIDGPYSLAVRIAYDHRNPIEAGAVEDPEQYEWSSARAWLTGERGAVRLVTEEPNIALPFELSYEDLRDEVLSLQRDRSFDSCRADLVEAFESTETASDEELRRLLEDRGVTARAALAPHLEPVSDGSGASCTSESRM